MKALKIICYLIVMFSMLARMTEVFAISVVILSIINAIEIKGSAPLR